MPGIKEKSKKVAKLSLGNERRGLEEGNNIIMAGRKQESRVMLAELDVRRRFFPFFPFFPLKKYHRAVLLSTGR